MRLNFWRRNAFAIAAAAFCTVAISVHAGAASAPASETFNIVSKQLGESRVVNVYVPPQYATNGGERFPVLYMPDGGLQEDFVHVATDIDTAIRAHVVRPLIVVGIENTERRRDMTGPTIVDSDRKIAPHVGGSAAFRAFIAEELMPAVRARYRTTQETAIVGESLAGLFVMETFFDEPELFDTYIAFSPSLWWNDQALIHSAAARLRAMPQSRKTLYFASASDDGLEAAVQSLQADLRASAPIGLHWIYEAKPDLKHSTIYVGASPQVFRQLFAVKPATQPIERAAQ